MDKQFKSFSLKLEIFFLIAGLLFGILFCTFIPEGAGFDEDAHLVRIFDTALFNIIPKQPPQEPNLTFSEFFTLSYQRRGFQSPASDLFNTENFLLKPDRENMTPRTTRSNYFPLLYLPQTVVAGIGWRIFDFPIIPVVIAMRLIGLIIYLFAGVLTIRMLPIGKWVFVILALSPLAIFQASTISGDGLTMSVCFIFTGLVLRTFSLREKAIDLRTAMLICGASLLLGMSKPGIIILLPLLFLLCWNKAESKKIPLIIISGVILSIIISVGWSYMVALNKIVGTTGNSRLEQLVLVFQNLGDFLPGYFIGIFRLIPKYYRDWVASYGYWVGQVPEEVFYLFPFALLLAYLTEGKNTAFSIKSRLVIFLVSMLCLGAMASAKFIFGYIPGQIYYNAQARYFLPFAPLFFLSFAGWVDFKPSIHRIAAPLAATLILATLTVYGYGLYQTYYTECVYPVNEMHPCRLPQYKNLDVSKPPLVNLTPKLVVTQTFSPHCSQISALRVLPLSVTPGETGLLQMSLIDPRDRVIAVSDFPVSDVAENKAIRFNFPTQGLQPFREYSFKIELIEETGLTKNISLLARKEDFYHEGRLTVDGAMYPLAADLFFQYECPPGTVQ
jgi:uncharacterized membrane protein